MLSELQILLNLTAWHTEWPPPGLEMTRLKNPTTDEHS